jgi:hypothetical protein
MKISSSFRILVFAITIYSFGAYVGMHNLPWYAGTIGMGLVGFFADNIARWVRA